MTYVRHNPNSNTPLYPVRYNIEIDAESDYSVKFDYVEESTGLPYDLTGYRAEVQVRQGTTGANEPTILLWYFSNSIANGITLGTDGVVTLTIPYTATWNAVWFEGIYDLVLIKPSGSRLKLAKGFFLINPTITRINNSRLANISIGGEAHPNNLGFGGLDSSVN